VRRGRTRTSGRAYVHCDSEARLIPVVGLRDYGVPGVTVHELAGIKPSHLTNTDCREKDLGRLTKGSNMTNVWVVSWKYSDNSGHGIVGVFDSARQGEVLHKALVMTSDGVRNYNVERFVLNDIDEPFKD
jgi:hypothetical protein